MVKKIPIVDVNVTSSISGAVQPLSPMIGGRSVSTDSLNSEVSSNQTIFYANSFILSAINIVIPKDFIRAFLDIGILSDKPSIGYSKPLTDSINSINDNSVFELSKAFSNLINTSDNFTKVIVFIRKPEDILIINENLSRIVDYNRAFQDNQSINDNRVFALSKVVSNSVNTSDDFIIIDFIKSFFETVDVSVIQDLAVRSVAKRLADSFTVNDSDKIDFTKGNFETIVTSDRNALVFTKPLIETLLQPLDLPAITVQKILRDAATNIVDFDIIDFTKFNADSVNTESFAVLNISKSIFDFQSTEDQTILNFVKNVFDSFTTVDSIPRIDFIKFLADTAIVEDLTNVFDGSTYTIDKTVTDFVISSENFSRIVNFIRAFQDVQSINELTAIDFNKILESTANNNDNLTLNNSLFKTDSIIGIEDVFNRVVEYSRSFTDEQLGQTDSNIFNFAKILADINSINDDDILSVTKVLSDILNISEISIIDFNKSRSDQVDTTDLFNRIVSFNRLFTEDVLQLDLAALSVTKSLSDAIGHFDTGPIFNLTKPFADAVQQPEDSDVLDLNKALADFNDPLDSNIINFTKVLADNATPLDNIDVFDGSTYSLIKNLPNDSIFTEDQNTNVVDFNRAFTDSINSITEAGTVANQNYIADYFLEDYIGESRLIV